MHWALFKRRYQINAILGVWSCSFKAMRFLLNTPPQRSLSCQHGFRQSSTVLSADSKKWVNVTHDSKGCHSESKHKRLALELVPCCSGSGVVWNTLPVQSHSTVQSNNLRFSLKVSGPPCKLWYHKDKPQLEQLGPDVYRLIVSCCVIVNGLSVPVREIWVLCLHVYS